MGCTRLILLLALAGLCAAKLDVKIVTDENSVDYTGKDAVNKNICKGTCTRGSSDETKRICVNVGEDKPIEFENFCLYDEALCRQEMSRNKLWKMFERVQCEKDTLFVKP